MALALFTQMTIPGAPGIYYGDEVGMTGGEDPDCRGAFPWHDPDSWNLDLLHAARTLGKLRRNHAALKTGDFEVIWFDDEAFAFSRAHDGDRLLVVVNRSNDDVGLVAPITADQPEVIWGRGEVAAEADHLRITAVPAWTGLIVQLS